MPSASNPPEQELLRGSWGQAGARGRGGCRAAAGRGGGSAWRGRRCGGQGDLEERLGVAEKRARRVVGGAQQLGGAQEVAALYVADGVVEGDGGRLRKVRRGRGARVDAGRGEDQEAGHGAPFTGEHPLSVG